MNELQNPFDVIVTELHNMNSKFETLCDILLKNHAADAKPDVLLDTKEVCKRLKVSRVTVWSYEKKKLLRPIRIGKNKRYWQSEIESLCK